MTTLRVAMAVVLVFLSAGCDPEKPRPKQTVPVTFSPAASPSTSPGLPVVKRWVGVYCSPEGAKAQTSSGGIIVCKRVGKDSQPRWYAQ